MKAYWILLIEVAAGCSMVACSSSDSSSTPDCAGYCAKQAQVGCKFQDSNCQKYCSSNLAITPWCESEVQSFVACAAMQPVTSYECDSIGSAELKTGFCKNEDSARKSCQYDGPADGLPDLSADCTALCQAQAGLACAKPTCEQDCNNGLAHGSDGSGACRGTYAATVHTNASLTAADWECDSNTPIPNVSPTTGITVACYGCVKSPGSSACPRRVMRSPHLLYCRQVDRTITLVDDLYHPHLHPRQTTARARRLNTPSSPTSPPFMLRYPARCQLQTGGHRMLAGPESNH